MPNRTTLSALPPDQAAAWVPSRPDFSDAVCDHPDCHGTEAEWRGRVGVFSYVRCSLHRATAESFFDAIGYSRQVWRAVAVMALPVLLFLLLPGCNSTTTETPLWIGAIFLALMIGVAAGFRSARWVDHAECGCDPEQGEVKL